MFKTPTLRALRGVLAVLLAGMALTVTAQTTQFTQPRPTPPKVDPRVIPPAGLKWVWMNKLYFNPIAGIPEIGTPEEKSLLEKIWAKEINNLQDPTDGKPMLGTALIGSVEHDGTKAILTMFNSFNSVCIQPGNGGGMIDMFATCPLRLVRFFPDGKSTVIDLLNDFCLLDLYDDANTTRSSNHTEYGFDERSGIVYLRTIQYGKVVPACNRAVRVFKVQ